MRTFFDPTKNKIFLDLDGVLADFDKFVFDNLGRTFNHMDGPGDDKVMWDFLSSVDRLYLKLEPTPYAQELVDLAFTTGADVEILTAIPRRTSMPTAHIDKIQWVEQYFGPDLKVNIGPYSRDKFKHCKTPGDVLIDDRVDNIQEWINKSMGIGICHFYTDFPGTKAAIHGLMRDYEHMKS